MNSYPVSRLKKTLRQVSLQHRLAQAEHELLFDFSRNFAAYRTVLEDAERNVLPHIPVFGLIMKDIEALKNTLPICLGEDVFNFNRSRQIYKYVHQVAQSQAIAYSLSIPESRIANNGSVKQLFEYCQHLPALSEAQLAAKSSKIEPSTDIDEGLGFLEIMWKDAGDNLLLSVLRLQESRTSTTNNIKSSFGSIRQGIQRITSTNSLRIPPIAAMRQKSNTPSYGSGIVRVTQDSI